MESNSNKKEKKVIAPIVRKTTEEAKKEALDMAMKQIEKN